MSPPCTGTGGLKIDQRSSEKIPIRRSLKRNSKNWPRPQMIWSTLNVQCYCSRPHHFISHVLCFMYSSLGFVCVCLTVKTLTLSQSLGRMFINTKALLCGLRNIASRIGLSCLRPSLQTAVCKRGLRQPAQSEGYIPIITLFHNSKIRGVLGWESRTS